MLDSRPHVKYDNLIINHQLKHIILKFNDNDFYHTKLFIDHLLLVQFVKVNSSKLFDQDYLMIGLFIFEHRFENIHACGQVSTLNFYLVVACSQESIINSRHFATT